MAAADLRCDWFRAARAGVRFQVQGAAVGQPPQRHAGTAVAALSAADDAGRSYRLRWDGIRGSDRLWMGEVVAEPMPEHERPDDVAWFELGTVDGPAARVVFAPPPAVPVGPTARRGRPTAIPSFTVRAIDDLGQEHEGHPGGWRGYGTGEGHAEFTLWPAVPRSAGGLRVVISTLWEARWADIELPSR